MRSSREKGQAILLVLVALGILLLGAMGLAIDGAQLFGQTQMAQVAADSAAQAAMMSIHQGVNNATVNPNTYFSTSGPFDCAPGTDQRLPCRYARMNGFGRDASDTVTVSFPICNGCGYEFFLAPLTPNQVQVTIKRNVANGLIRMLGAGAFTGATATGIAAAVSIITPVPILILHPTLPGSLSGNGNTSIHISGGPSRSIQVNSRASTTASPPSTGEAYAGTSFFIDEIDLSLAGPNGRGADFGVFGGPATQPSRTIWNLGTEGKYDQPASPLDDPLINILPPGANPSDPPIPIAPAPASITPSSSPNYGCADTSPAGCTLYYPGRYADGIEQKQGTAIFQPGVYIMENGKGFGASSNGRLQTCVPITPYAGWPAGLPAGTPYTPTGCVADTTWGTGNGMIVYNQGGGLFKITGGGAAAMKGPPETDGAGHFTRYAGILFFQDRSSPAATGPGINSKHSLGGGGCIDLIGTIYITNTVATMTADPNHYQMVEYNGNPCSGTYNEGMIITDVLKMVGTSDLRMSLNPQGYLKLRQIALVGGGPHL